MNHRGVAWEWTQKNPTRRRGFLNEEESAEADLAKDALACQQLGAKADDEAHHGQATIPGLSKVDETEAGLRSVRHGEAVSSGRIVTKGGALLTVPGDTFLATIRD